MTDEFPIGMRFGASVEAPVDLGEAEITSEVDTSGWFGDGEDDEFGDSAF